MVQARRWRVIFEVEFTVPETRGGAYRWFYRFHRWLMSMVGKGLKEPARIRLEPVDPEPEPHELGEEEVRDYYVELGF